MNEIFNRRDFLKQAAVLPAAFAKSINQTAQSIQAGPENVEGESEYEAWKRNIEARLQVQDFLIFLAINLAMQEATGLQVSPDKFKAVMKNLVEKVKAGEDIWEPTATNGTPQPKTDGPIT